MTKIEFTHDALAKMTQLQHEAILRLADREQYKLIDCHAAGLDLPDGYLSVRFEYGDGSGTIYGGISPDGDLST